MAALRHGIKISSREVSSSTIDSQSGSDDAGPSVSPMEDAEEWWEHEERLDAIEEALRSADLSLREQLVLEVLYGRAEGKDVAALCGCHPSQVTRDRARIAAKLRRQMAG
jgi:DNA-directed RNA polymerase specialized sigma subunit